MSERRNSGDSPFKNSKGKIKPKFVNNANKRKRRRGLVNTMQSPIVRSTSHGNGSFTFSNPNPICENTLYFNESPLKWDDLNEREDNQLLSDFPQCSEDVEWIRTVRSMEKKDSFDEASTSTSLIECWSPSVGSDNREKPRSTDVWRKLLFPEADMGPLSISEEIFKENVKVLLDIRDLAVSKPSSWSRLDSDCFLKKVQSFVGNWSRELLKEKEKLVEEVWVAKEKLNTNYDMVTNRLSLLNDVFEESVTFMNFSESQKQTIQSEMRELSNIESKLIDCEGYNSVFPVASTLTSRLKEKDQEVEKSRKQADECREELRQTRSKLYETKSELNSLVFSNNHKTRLEQKEMQDKLSEIRSMLVKKADLGNQNSFYFTGDLHKQNKQIIKDIKNLIEDQQEIVEVTAENIQKTADSSVLEVTENEIHLVTLIASFMKVTPFPVSTEFLYMYVAKIDNIVSLQYVEKLLKKFPTFFKEEAIGPGSTEKNWSYLDLKPVITI